MTSPRTNPRSTPGPARGADPRGLILAGLALGGLLGACSSDEAEVAQAPVRKAAVRAAAPPPPPAPTVTPVVDLMDKYSIDERIYLPENRAPDNDKDRVAVLEFFHAFAHGHNDVLRSRMSDLDAEELDLVAATDEWQKTIDGITEVMLETGTNPLGDRCVLAIFEVNDEYQPQLWNYKGDEEGYRFEAVATPPGIMDKLYGDDFIARWHDLLQEEIKLANQLDAEIETAPIVLGESSSGGSASGGRPKPPKKPSFSPGNPGKPDRRPPGKKRKPPGAR